MKKIEDIIFVGLWIMDYYINYVDIVYGGVLIMLVDVVFSF